MDMSAYTKSGSPDHRAKRLMEQSEAIRRNQDSVAAIFYYLADVERAATHGYTDEAADFAYRAHEAFEEIPEHDRIALYRAPSSGGIWATWQREVLKTGSTGRAWDAYIKRSRL